MLAADFPAFEQIIRQLEKVFTKSVDDATMQVYWQALRGDSLSSVQQFASLHLRNGKFFPKPYELHAKEDRKPPKDPKTDGAFREGEERAIARLELLREINAPRWLAMVGPESEAARHWHEHQGRIWYDLPNRCWRAETARTNTP